MFRDELMRCLLLILIFCKAVNILQVNTYNDQKQVVSYNLISGKFSGIIAKQKSRN